jgi:DNA processing protein
VSGGGTLAARRACAACLARSWLLAELIGPLDRCARDAPRLFATLALDGDALITALAGRRREALRAALASRPPPRPQTARDLAAVCCHDRSYPAGLRSAAAPRALFVAGGLSRLHALTRAPVVAITGTARASAYGAEMARELARTLAASGVTVATTLQSGIAHAARQGVLESGRHGIAVAAAGLRARATHTACAPGLGGEHGCTITELPGATGGRTFGEVATTRTLAGIASLVLVVEARETARELRTAHLARASKRQLGAVPGRATSPVAAGPHALLRAGATLVRCAEDALELLPAAGRRTLAPTRRDKPSPLPARLRSVLERVDAGCDTAAGLCAREPDPGGVLLALSELELLGVLTRGRAGRYLRRGTRAPAGTDEW